MPMGLESAVDLDRYPLDRRDPAVLKTLMAQWRAEFESTGTVLLRDFLKRGAIIEIAEMVVESDDSVADSTVSVTTLTYDRIPESSPLKLLYRWEPLLDFVSGVVGEHAYRSADDRAAVTVHGHEPADENWHFDAADYTLTLHVLAPEYGGMFEYVPLPWATGESFPAQLIAGPRRHSVRVLPTLPGALMLHAGRLSVHRVTPSRGPVPRVSATMDFHSRPGRTLGEEARRRRFGAEGRP
ncbi:Uncharacterised protein [Nocardia otitidiscaviarum]|uniref:Fe2OG dioxygenase domain-containing protein n=2 Tax=Nocardia otitidiscaviarum TaxID=1823 RepID=A0A379JGP0_9NOCA|nr:Uncharacterised protein [Nocardia otitidiscaviarum]